MLEAGPLADPIGNRVDPLEEERHVCSEPSERGTLAQVDRARVSPEGVAVAVAPPAPGAGGDPPSIGGVDPDLDCARLGSGAVLDRRDDLAVAHDLDAVDR